MQSELEGISEELRIPGSKALGPIQGVRSFLAAEIYCPVSTSVSYNCVITRAGVLRMPALAMQAVKRAHNILNQDKDKIAKDFAPDKKVSLHDTHCLSIITRWALQVHHLKRLTAAKPSRCFRIPSLWVQDAGMRAIKDLDTSLDQFIELMERKDKQDIPIKQQEALGFVSIIEEAMVKGFPYEVPKQYANLPQLKVGG